MKAVIITAPGGPEVLQLQDRNVPIAAPDQVLIKVLAAGINRPDIAQRKGNYPPPPNAPQDIPGLEVSGFIEACGKDVKRWNKGDAVCALLPGGGYAAYVVAHENHCLPIPANVSIEEAASLPETCFTVWHNVFQKGRLQKDENFLVHGGSSGIGITAIQLAKAFGATVFTTAGSGEKCKACEALGADVSVNYKTNDFEVALSSYGVDVLLDMIGGDYIPKNLRLLKVDGRLVFINAMKGGLAEVNAIDIMRRRLTITGSTLRNRSDSFKALLAKEVEDNVWPLFEQRLMKPVIAARFKLQDVKAAHELMEDSSHIGKIILDLD